ncbi:MAG TPA: TadE/TadG family type IV pilus assembly protein [Bryobacteraceae bacterium]|nr:TadE/TadG family type IV pilus assembly protein [Bryobacteraceae bacterium]
MTKKPMNGRRRRRGQELIEFTLTFLPLLGFICLLLDLGWVIYKRSTLQFAVREGCRLAITNQTVTTGGKTYGEADSIRLQVQARAMGFLGRQLTDLDGAHAGAGYATITVNYYCASVSIVCTAAQVNLSTPLAVPACGDNVTEAPNQSGNIVEVSVMGFQAFPMAPVYRGHSPFYFIARSSDRMEGNPIGGPPPVLTCS